MACGMEHHVDAPSAVTVEASAEGDGAGSSCWRTSSRARRCGCPSTSRTTGRRRPGRRPRRARRPDAGPGGRAGVRRDRGAHRRHVGGVLATERHRADGAPDLQQAGALQPLPAPAGDGAQRGPRRPRQGRDRSRLRGPLLLGHRDLRRPLPVPHDPALRQAGADVPLRRLDAARERAREVGHAARCTRGGRSPARRPPRGTPPAPRSTTSTPTSPTRCATTRGSQATSASSSTRGRR